MKVLLLAGNTLRAKSYAQILSENILEDTEITGLFYGFKEEPELIKPNLETINYCKKNNLFLPDFTEAIATTFQKNNWYFEMVDNKDVNSSLIVERIESKKADLVIFAGYGGQILDSKHFKLDAKYLHMHPGELPIERGSTTIYYSLLNLRRPSVTAFYMTEKIDDGNNILCSSYPIPSKNVNIDVFIDPVLRADCFLNALKMILNRAPVFQSKINDIEYYVIHPLLKHLAILSLR